MHKGILCIALLFSAISYAQETIAVEKTIQFLFDGMRQSDSAMAHKAFDDNCVLITTYYDKKSHEPRKHVEDIKEFLEAIGKPKYDVWDERISNLNIQIDDNIAHAWMNYSFYFNNELSHCGVNSMELIKSDDGWKIVYISDSRRKKDCEKAK